MADLTDHELTRRNVWARSAAAYCSWSSDSDFAARCADRILAKFDERFKEPEVKKHATRQTSTTTKKNTKKQTTPQGGGSGG